MKWKLGLIGLSLIWLSLLGLNYADASFGEISLMGSYSKTNYGSGNFTRSRRYTGSLGINLTSITEVEVSYSNSESYYNQSSGPYQTITTQEQTLALSIVQTLVPSDWYVQPYVKAGAAQYNRKQKGTEDGIPTREVVTKSPSAVLGGGLRVFIGRHFSIKAEATSYIADFRMREAKNNVAAQVGLGWRF